MSERVTALCLLLAAMIAALGLASQAAAQAPDVDADLRCAVVMFAIISEAPEEQRNNLVAGAMFFVGRLDGVVPDAELGSEIRRVVQAMDTALFETERQRCADILQAKGVYLDRLGAAFSESGDND